MSRLIKTEAYVTLVKNIAELYNHAHQALVESYGRIGRRIVEQEQKGNNKAEYGVQLLEHLSEDLQHKLGSGSSKSNLRNMRRFYLNNRIHQPAGELNRSQHINLASLRDGLFWNYETRETTRKSKAEANLLASFSVFRSQQKTAVAIRRVESNSILPPAAISCESGRTVAIIRPMRHRPESRHLLIRYTLHKATASLRPSCGSRVGINSWPM